MDGGTLSDASIPELAEPFLCVKVDADEREDLLRKYAVRDLPCFVMVPPEGKGLIARLDNARDNGVARVAGALRAAARAWNNFLEKRAKAAPQVEKTPDDPAAHQTLADAYAIIQDWEHALPSYQKAIDLSPGTNHEYALEFVIFGSLTIERNAEAAAAADRFLADHGGSKRLPQVLYWRGLAAHRLHDPATARRMWERVLAEFPTGKWGDLARVALSDLPK